MYATSNTSKEDHKSARETNGETMKTSDKGESDITDKTETPENEIVRPSDDSTTDDKDTHPPDLTTDKTKEVFRSFYLSPTHLTYIKIHIGECVSL